MVFLLGLGAALGAYATGGLDYVSRQHFFQSWYQPGPTPEHDMVLRVSGTALNGACTARYAVDNRSGRRVFVVFAPEAGPGDVRLAPRRDDRQGSYGYDGPVSDRYNSGMYGSYVDAREEFRPADGPYRGGYRDVDPRYAQGYPEDATGDQAPPPVEVAPGERKILGRADATQVADAVDPGYDADAEPCGGDRIVRLQITDCAADNGACVAAMNSPGGTNP